MSNKELKAKLGIEASSNGNDEIIRLRSELEKMRADAPPMLSAGAYWLKVKSPAQR